MVDNDVCEYCGATETIKHLIWDCRRSRKGWELVNRILNECGIQQSVTFNELFAGFKPVNLVMEAIATKIIQLILQIDRSNDICDNKIKAEIVFLGKMYQYGKQSELWQTLIDKCKE